MPISSYFQPNQAKNHTLLVYDFLKKSLYHLTPELYTVYVVSDGRHGAYQTSPKQQQTGETKMKQEIKQLVKSSNKVWVDYFGCRGSYNDCVDIVTKDDIKRDNITNVHVRFMDANYGGVAIRISDGSMWKLENGRPAGDYLGYPTEYDLKALVPLYNKEYLDRYSESFANDEWVEDMTNVEGMLGVRDDFNTFFNGMRHYCEGARFPDYEGVAIRNKETGFRTIGCNGAVEEVE